MGKFTRRFRALAISCSAVAMLATGVQASSAVDNYTINKSCSDSRGYGYTGYGYTLWQNTGGGNGADLDTVTVESAKKFGNGAGSTGNRVYYYDSGTVTSGAYVFDNVYSASKGRYVSTYSSTAKNLDKVRIDVWWYKAVSSDPNADVNYTNCSMYFDPPNS